MLIQPDINELGDKRLDPTEGLAQLKERNAADLQKKHIEGQAELENQEKARGNPMHYSELITKLKAANPALLIADGGVKGAVAVRIADPREDSGKRYLTGFYKDTLYEFDFVTTDHRGLATRCERGWRGVLLMLMKQNALTFNQVVKHFGDALGQRSGRWDKQVQEYRT